MTERLGNQLDRAISEFRGVSSGARPSPRLREIVALIGRWSEGDLILPGEELKPLHPRKQGIWELRTHYGPGHRLLGMLAEYEVFIAFGLFQRNELGRGGSAEWNNACASVGSQWRELFGEHRPLFFHGQELTIKESKAFWS